LTTQEQTIDNLLGYHDGQRTARTNPHLDGRPLRNVGLHRLEDCRRAMNLDARRFLKGFRQGYIDELNGTAPSLPEESEERV